MQSFITEFIPERSQPEKSNGILPSLYSSVKVFGVVLALHIRENFPRLCTR